MRLWEGSSRDSGGDAAALCVGCVVCDLLFVVCAVVLQKLGEAG